MAEQGSARITPDEIARRLSVDRRAVYSLLNAGLLPGIRMGRGRWIITRRAYEQWEATCGLTTPLKAQPEATAPPSPLNAQPAA